MEFGVWSPVGRVGCDESCPRVELLGFRSFLLFFLLPSWTRWRGQRTEERARWACR